LVEIIVNEWHRGIFSIKTETGKRTRAGWMRDGIAFYQRRKDEWVIICVNSADMITSMYGSLDDAQRIATLIAGSGSWRDYHKIVPRDVVARVRWIERALIEGAA
jgi:hypothetical protein